MQDRIGNGRRYGPILEMMSNGRIQEMSLWDFSDFYRRIDVSSMATPSRLQKLSLPLYTRPFKSVLVKLLKCCPCLTELTLEVSDFYEAFEDTTANFTIWTCLEKLVIRKLHEAVVVEVAGNTIQSVSAGIHRLLRPPSDLGTLLSNGHLTELSTHVSLESCSQLNDVLRWNPKLRYANLTCDLHHSQAIMDAITSTRARILSESCACELHRVELRLYVNRAWLPDNFTVALEFQAELTEPVVSSRVVMTPIGFGIPLRMPRSLLDLFLQYGWTLNTLETNEVFNDTIAATLDNITHQRGSKLASLFLDTSSLTLMGLESMIRIIDRSNHLQRLEFAFSELHEEEQQMKLERLIRRYGKRLTGLKMMGSKTNMWVPKVMALCPTRLQVPALESFGLFSTVETQLPPGCSHWIASMALEIPELESFGLFSNDKTQLPPGCVSWIASMVSSKPQEQPTPLIALSTQVTNVPSSGPSVCEWNPLGSVHLSDIPLQSEDWKVILQAMDFSALKEVRLQGDGFSMDHLKLAIDRVPVNTNPVARLAFSTHSRLVDKNSDEWASQVARLRSKVPNVE